MTTTYEVSDVGFEPNGTTLITYMERSDLRCDGAVAVRHTARIVPTDQYAEGVQRLVDAATALLGDALEDWRRSDPVPERTFAADLDDQDDELDDDELDSANARRNWDAVEQARADGD